MGLINKSKIRARVKELDKEDKVSSVADEVEVELEKKVDSILVGAVNRAVANGRRTILARDL